MSAASSARKFVKRGVHAIEPLLFFARELQFFRGNSFLEDIERRTARSDGLPVGRFFGDDGAGNAQRCGRRKNGSLRVKPFVGCGHPIAELPARHPGSEAVFIRRQS